MEQKWLMLCLKETDTINNSDIYDICKNLFFIEKEHEEHVLQGIEQESSVKAWVGAKRADGMTMTVTTKNNAIKMTFDKRFAIPWILNFLSTLYIVMDLKKI